MIRGVFSGICWLVGARLLTHSACQCKHGHTLKSTVEKQTRRTHNNAAGYRAVNGDFTSSVLQYEGKSLFLLVKLGKHCRKQAEPEQCGQWAELTAPLTWLWTWWGWDMSSGGTDTAAAAWNEWTHPGQAGSARTLSLWKLWTRCNHDTPRQPLPGCEGRG